MTTTPESGAAPKRGMQTVRRHRLSTRVWHWTNAVTLIVLLMSGLMIFNAHPRLYWGSYGANPDPAWLEIRARDEKGYLTVADLTVETTGVLGAWRDDEGRVHTRAFPGWATIPSQFDLAGARRWHLTFAWIFSAATVVYLVVILVNGHLRGELLTLKERPCPPETAGRRVVCRYGLGQKAGYVVVLFLLLPVMILSGLTMSPTMVAHWPWLLDLFAGRQSARSIHFIAAVALVVFVIGHVALVLLAGPWSKLRAMVTGRHRQPRDEVG